MKKKNEYQYTEQLIEIKSKRTKKIVPISNEYENETNTYIKINSTEVANITRDENVR